jgi:hypothetical protein
LLCSSCGHDNPRENRYCGMCGTPFPHRPLTVPDAQSTLTFNSAPIEVTTSQLPVHKAEPPQPAPPPAVAAVEVAKSALVESKPVEPPPIPDVSQPRVKAVPAPIVEPQPPAVAPTPAVAAAIERVPIAEVTKFVAAPEKTAVEIPKPSPVAVREERVPAPESPRPEVVASTGPLVEPPPAVLPPREAPTPSVAAKPVPSPPPVSREVISRPSAPPTPEVRKPERSAPTIAAQPAPPRRESPPRVDTASRGPSIVKRPPAPEPITPPPPSAGMPTFKSVAEASGAAVVTPFEPPDAKSPDEDRELQEFVASFRYTPPNESVDELTMRSEVPVLDAEAPVTPSHPSFDDDVPPPPEAGPHPTGEEYYPPVDPATGRSRFLDIPPAQHQADSPHVPMGVGSSFFGVSNSSSGATAPPLDDAAQPSRSRWLLWSSLVLLVAIFGGLGFLEGRAQIYHSNQGPIALVRQQYEKLRQRISMSRVTKPPATLADSRPAETQAPTEPLSKPAASDQATTTASNAEPDNSAPANPPAAPAAQPAAPPDQQRPKPTPATQQLAPPAGNTAAAKPPAATPATVQPKPTPDAAVAKPETAKPIEAPASTPMSKHQPGQQEFDNAMQASDDTAAAAWLWKSTSRGNPDAPVRLADMYIKGKGVPRSCEQALVLLRSAATKQNAPARNRLAVLYANGTCVARDRVKAYQLMSSALVADPSNDWAQQNRKELWNQLTPEERAQAEKYR